MSHAGRRLALALLAALVAVAPAVWPEQRAAAAPATEATAEAAAADPLEPPAITAAGAVLWDSDERRILYGRDERLGRPMASTTKIMTVLLALEAGAADEELVVSEVAAAVGAISGAASLELRAGQRLPVRSALAGLVLRSGNDAAVAVAEHLDGTEEAFVTRMNRRAAQLGLSDTSFVNASGLTDDPDHRASPLDLALLAEQAMAHTEFAAWAGAGELTVPALAPMTNRNELLGRLPEATGVKTGYTRLAGLCLVASASRDGRTLYAVVLGSEDSFGDAAALLRHGFDDYRRVEPLAHGATGIPYRWADGATVQLLAADALAATLPAGTTPTWRVVVPPQLARPVAAGQSVGHAELLVGGRVWRRVRLQAGSAVPEADAAAPAAAVGRAVQEALRAAVRLQPVERAVGG